MSGRLAVDFGTSNTVVALWDESAREGRPVFIPDFGRLYRQGSESVAVIPSLIHYTADNRRWIGSQVMQQGLYSSERTFRWMKRYISNRTPMRFRLDGRDLTPQSAGADFLSAVLRFAVGQVGLQDEEVAFSAPVEAYEHYEDWLTSVAEDAGIRRFRLIDEPSAAALGYGAHIQPGSVFLIFDFGGGTMHASVILVEQDFNVHSGRRCRVLGKAGRDIGGSSIDQWLFETILRQNRRQDSDEDIRRLSNALLVECERVKEQLSVQENADLSVLNPDTGALLSATFTRAEFDQVLDEHDLFTEINHVLRSALNSARERGYSEDNLQSVLMVGGSSQIPAVQRALRQFFGKERVLMDHPLDAVARGAAAFAAGVDFYDHIQHDYAIRYIDPQTGTYDYRVIVQRGTPYPTAAPVCRLAVKASYDGQKQLGISIFEKGSPRTTSARPMELVFDPAGAARLIQVTPAEQETRTLFEMNAQNPTFLTADPPALQGEARFEVEFAVDSNKRLTITARDRQTGRLTHKDYPVVRLV